MIYTWRITKKLKPSRYLISKVVMNIELTKNGNITMLFRMAIFTIALIFSLFVKANAKEFENTKSKLQVANEVFETEVDKLLKLDINLLEVALSIKLIEKYQGSIVQSSKPYLGEYRFLGRIEHKSNAESIFSDIGIYGTQYGMYSIWNESGVFGGNFSLYSAFSEIANKPPLIIKDGTVIGYLSVNKTQQGAMNPHLLRYVFTNY